MASLGNSLFENQNFLLYHRITTLQFHFSEFYLLLKNGYYSVEVNPHPPFLSNMHSL